MAELDFNAVLSLDGASVISGMEVEACEFNATMGQGGWMPEVYTGAILIIPSLVSQELETANKFVKDNIVIEEIPYSQVSNPAGGWTVTIA